MAERCPECRADMQGDPIPERYRDEFYGGKTHYTRLLWLLNQNSDRVYAWKCPLCGFTSDDLSAFRKGPAEGSA